MKNLKLAFRFLFKKGENNFIKIFSLGVGLSISLLILSNVYYEMTYDKFYPDSERIYQIQEKYVFEGKSDLSSIISGGVAVGMKDIPEVESSTRFVEREDIIRTSKEESFNVKLLYADTCLFEIFPRPIEGGNDIETLNNLSYIMVSESLAKKLGGNVLGKSIYLDKRDKEFVINSIFKDIPNNSHFKYDAAVSINHMGVKHTLQWDSGETYSGYVKLKPNVNLDNLPQAMAKVQKKYLADEEDRFQGEESSFSLLPLIKVHFEEIKKIQLVLVTIALAILFTAIMNYVLILLSSLLSHSKSLAIHKSLGAKNRNIMSLIFTETTLHLMLSLFLASIIILMLKKQIGLNLSLELGYFMTFGNLILLLTVIILVSIIISIIPYLIVKNTPILHTINQNKKFSRMLLLSIQIVGASFVFVFLILVSRQYNLILKEYLGYNHTKVYYADIGKLSVIERENIRDEIQKMPGISSASVNNTLLFEGAGGNVALGENNKILLYAADIEGADEYYLDLMEIELLSGSNFTDKSLRDILVSENFAKKMAIVSNWNDGVIGKNVLLSGNGYCNIIGVYKDMVLGESNYRDPRPSFISYKNGSQYLNVKFNNASQENIKRVNEKLIEMLPYKQELRSYSEDIYGLYSGLRFFRKSLLQGSFIALFIAAIGLVGYTNNTIRQKRKDIAIFRVCGATNLEIIKLFLFDITKITIPSIVMGIILAYFANNKWTEDFSNKAELSVITFLVSAIFILIIMNLITFVNSLKISKQNPVESLKKE